MVELDTFLLDHPPFDGLDRHEVQALLVGATECSFAAGEVVLVEDGAPSPGLYVIRAGAMEIVHEDQPIQVLGVGECFGHPSLLTGMAPAFTVRAREASVCVRLTAEASRRLLGTPAGTTYVAETLRGRLTSTGQTVHGLRDLGTTPVSAITRPAVFCPSDATIAEAAKQLSQAGVSALLIRLTEGRLGIVSDADIRARVASGELDVGLPARAIARTPVPTVPAEQAAIEVTVDMLAAGTEHVAILDGGQVSGIISAPDLLGLDARSPMALRRTILRASDEDDLLRAVADLSHLFTLLVRARVPSSSLGRVLSLQHDAIVGRLIEFSFRRWGPAPVPWAWLDLGSAARREFTLASDQDNALAYQDPDPREASVDGYFQRLGKDVNAGLTACGIASDHNGVLAGNPRWCMPTSAWVRTFESCLQNPDESHLVRATVAFDFRSAAGGLAVAPALTDRIRAARGHPRFMRLMARSGSGYPVALGFRGQMTTGRGGAPEGRIDLKRGAIIPLVNLVRFHALVNGVTISPTLDRLHAVALAGGLDRSLADVLAEAFEVISRIRFEHHAQLLESGAVPDNLLAPDDLSPIARAELREALAVVRRAQRQLAGWVPAVS